MFTHKVDIIVAGHVCLDIIPSMTLQKDGMSSILVPGKLVNIGPAHISTGGAVSNTGIALHKLGLSTRLMGKVGNDYFGSMILDLIKYHSPQLVEDMIVSRGEDSSYSIVISPPGFDRVFLHCNGTNDTYLAADLNEERLKDAEVFHFGYPPLMKQMYIKSGQELLSIFLKAKQFGLTTSLDMAKPDAESEAGQVDWRKILNTVLPSVDIFLPSFDEILYMLDQELYNQVQADGGFNETLINTGILDSMADELLLMGTAIVGIKLGEYGLYVRTTKDLDRINALGKCSPNKPEIWLNRELFAPCFQVDVVGTTGAGDSTIAGFLAGIVKGLSLENIMMTSVAVGACNVEAADAIAGIPSWKALQQRIEQGWSRRAVTLSGNWKWNQKEGVWIGSNDRV